LYSAVPPAQDLPVRQNNEPRLEVKVSCFCWLFWLWHGSNYE